MTYSLDLESADNIDFSALRAPARTSLRTELNPGPGSTGHGPVYGRGTPFELAELSDHSTVYHQKTTSLGGKAKKPDKTGNLYHVTAIDAADS